MWGSISSALKSKSGLRRRTGLASPIIATIAAASVSGAIATSARASVPGTSSEMFGAKSRVHSPGVAVKSDPIAVEPVAAMLQATLDMAGGEQLRRPALQPRVVRISGIGSTYNPTRPGDRSGSMETASGERY